MRKKNYTVVILSVLLMFLITSAVKARQLPKRILPNGGTTQISLSPGFNTVDQIIQNHGNIATTIDNYGYVGGYSHYGKPSGEWPRNSGHSYLAEIRYWMGATMPNGDTIVANSVDDFQAIEMPIDGVDDYKIYLSTDTTRYYNYDNTDTVGLGESRPAYGWRVWNENLDNWDYNQKFNTLAAGFTEGGPTSEQDSYYRFNDAASGTSLMGLELTQSVYQWNFCYNEDFMFIVLDITNTSANDYADFAFGLYVDLDVGGEDGTGENGRLNDAVVYDTANGWAYNYDVVGYDPGWDAKTGIMGTKLLETPNNVGMTAFRTDDWAVLPNNDPGKYAMINSSQYDTPLPPTDQFYIQAVRGINLAAGQTVRVVYALIGAEDSLDFVQNAEAVQTLYDEYYVGPAPPQVPTLSVRAGDEKVYLKWNSAAESSVDPLSGSTDFAGYKLYRSIDLGKTWGVVDDNNTNNCLALDYETVSNYSVSSPGDPIPHSYIDTNLYNEVEYWYCLAAYDQGDSLTNGDPLQNGFGVAGSSINVVRVTPRSNPAGYLDVASTTEHQYNGSETPSDGEVFPIIFDWNAMIDGDYKVIFEDTPEATYWSLINTTTSDTVLTQQTLMNSDDPGMFDVVNGLRVVVNDGDVAPTSYGQTAGDSNLVMGTFYGVGMNNFFSSDMTFGHEHFRSTYELRYTGDSTLAAWIFDGYYGSDYPYWVPFEIWNTSTNQRVSLAVYDFNNNDIWEPYDLLQVVNYPYDSTQSVAAESFPNYYSWLFGFDETIYNPQIGDVYTIEGAPLNGPNDEFLFKINNGISSQKASEELKNIKVVPNPYFVSYESIVEQVYDLNTALHFINLPDECTIRIYNLAGDLVKTIEHDKTGGDAVWNLLSVNNQLVASGVYFYHVESPYGEFLGRFAVVK